MSMLKIIAVDEECYKLAEKLCISIIQKFIQRVLKSGADDNKKLRNNLFISDILLINLQKRRTQEIRKFLKSVVESRGSVNPSEVSVVTEEEGGIFARSTRWIGSVVANTFRNTVEIDNSFESDIPNDKLCGNLDLIETDNQLEDSEVESLIQNFDRTFGGTYSIELPRVVEEQRKMSAPINVNSYLWTQVPIFEGTHGKDISGHISQLDRWFILNSITDNGLKVAALRLKLNAEINSYIDSLDEYRSDNYDELVRDLKEKYSGMVGRWPSLHRLRTFQLDTSNISRFRASLEEFKRLILSNEGRLFFHHMRVNVASCKSFDDCCVDLEAVLNEYKARQSKKSSSISHSSIRNSSRSRKFEGNCNHCQIHGHKARDCHYKKKGLPPGDYSKRGKESQSQNTYSSQVPQSHMVSSGEALESLIIFSLNIDRFSLETLADAGSNVNIVRRSTIFKLGKEDSIQPYSLLIRGAFEKAVTSIGRVKLSFMGNDKPVCDEFLVLQDRDFGNQDVDLVIGIKIWRQVGFSEFEKIDKRNVKNVAGVPQSCSIRVKSTVMSNEEAIVQLRNICPKIDDVFAKDESDLGCYYKVLKPQKFINETAAPFKPYKYPLRMKDIARKMLDSLLTKGVIVCSQTENLHNVLMVKKSNENFRSVVDLRLLNQNTVKTNYPEPNINVTLNIIAGANYYCTIDLPEAFHQFRLSSSDYGKFGIYLDGEIYYYVRLPIGYINASMLLQKEMNLILQECPCLNFFFDDGLITTRRSLNNHFENVAKARKCLQSKGLKVSLPKSVLVASKVPYLGYVLNEKGFSVNPSSLNSIMSIRTSKNQDEVQKFLGSIGFFQRFIPRYSKTLSCIIKLLSKKTVEDLLKPLIVYSDASLIGYGAVCCQNQPDGLLKLLFYFSKKRKNTLKNRDSCFLDAQCIVLMTRKYRYKFLGAKLIWYCDNLPLLHMLKRGTDHPIFAPWCMELSCYDITFRYVEGVKNSFADFLSRFCTKEKLCDDDPELDEPKFMVNFITFDEISLSQKKDPSLRKRTDLVLVNNVLGKFESIWGRKVFKPYIPDEVMSKIIFNQHSYGYFSTNKLRKSLQLRYLNDNMLKLVKDCVSNCLICARRNCHKSRNNRAKVLCYSSPRENYSLDVCDPINSVGTSYKYILLATDSFSWYWMSRSTKSITCEEVRESLLSIFHVYEYPSSVRCDNASYLRTTRLTDLLQEMKIDVSFSIPYAHKGNTLVERSFHTLEAILNKCLQLDQTNKCWTDYLEIRTFYYNTSVLEDAEVTSYKLFYGIPPHLPTDPQISTSFGLVDRDNALADYKYRQTIVRNMAALLKFTKRMIIAAHDKNWIKFQVGDPITIKKHNTRKLKNSYIGPYKIETVKDTTVTYRKGKKLLKIHKSLIKLVSLNAG
uniref:RNA-directed DNA polymerase n=1 Tax=Strongyloides venezuelensis TaxID=75913 RepID=A0A0K0FFF7_STRVS